MDNMKHLVDYIIESDMPDVSESIKISESIKHLPPKTTGIIVFDIDDTLLKADSDTIKIYKRKPGEKEIALSTEEFANDPDINDPAHKSWYDYRDFEDPQKVYKSIIQGTPLIRNLRIMDSYLDAGYEFCFLTARGCEEVVKDAIDDFLLTRNKNGVLKELGSIFNKALSHAVNDAVKQYAGKTDGDKKANILIDLCKKYDRVVFVDDDKKNVRAAKDLQLDNLTVIKAWAD